jgi:hypothetical protein
MLLPWHSWINYYPKKFNRTDCSNLFVFIVGWAGFVSISVHPRERNVLRIFSAPDFLQIFATYNETIREYVLRNYVGITFYAKFKIIEVSTNLNLRDVSLLPQCEWYLRSSRMLRQVDCGNLPAFRDNLSVPSSRVNHVLTAWSLQKGPIGCFWLLGPCRRDL